MPKRAGGGRGAACESSVLISAASLDRAGPQELRKGLGSPLQPGLRVGGHSLKPESRAFRTAAPGRGAWRGLPAAGPHDTTQAWSPAFGPSGARGDFSQHQRMRPGSGSLVDFYK